MGEIMDPKPLVLDDIIKTQARDETQRPLIGYPREGTVADFELFTARDLDALVERAAKFYSRLPIDPIQEPVVSLIGPSDLDYLVTKFALSRLGFGVLLLSTRLTPEACLKLLKENECRVIIQSPSKLSFNLGSRTQELDNSILVSKIATSNIYRDSTLDSQKLMKTEFSSETASQRTAIVYHSSGSTGVPKSIATSHEKLLSPIPTGKGSKAMTSSPLCHAFASKLTLNCMMVGKCMYLTNADMPSTAETLVEACRAVQPDVFLTVPYVLKLVVETEAGVLELTNCKQVVSSGSQLSDDLGTRLVKAGVNVETLFAGTEPGMVGSSMNRPPGDDAWDYIRLVPAVQQNVQYKPLGDNTFEFVYLSTLPTLNMSNSDDPPGSFHSSDILTPHPTIPNAWKYIGRIDDRVTLSTGEKVLPLPMEGRVRQESSVREAVVFGIDRAIPGLLVFRSEAAKELYDGEFITKIWPAIEEANSAAEAFGRIDRDMIVCLPASVHIPAADKESIIRARVYKMYAQHIQAAYDRMERGSEGGLVLESPELETYILQLVRSEVGISIPSAEVDFHLAGMDSLQAIRLRSLILKKLAVGDSKKLSQNVVFESGNVNRLAQKIVGSRDKKQDVDREDEDEWASMEDMIDRYSTFVPRTFNHTDQTPSNCVLMTGATGSLGAYLLSQLLDNSNISQILCIVRGSDPLSRIQNALESRNLPHDNLSTKLTVINGDLTLPDLGISKEILQDFHPLITHIIHAAWPVNFQLSLQAFEPQLRSLQNLIQLSLSVPGPEAAKLFFCSSISVALGTTAPAMISESQIPSLIKAQSTGYARSKLVGERIVEKAVLDAGAKAYVLRIGQVVGDTQQGLWNDTEAWPLIIRSALTLGTLPALNMTCSWLPVDILASTISELAFSTIENTAKLPTVFNIENPFKFHWTRDLLPVLQKQGLRFKTTSPKQWLRQLSQYQDVTPAEEALVKNPAVKLLDYFENLVDSFSEAELGARQEVVFETSKAREFSRSLRMGHDVLAFGLIDKFLINWMGMWRG